MCVPEGLSPGYIARALGPDVRVPTIDVESQTSGPRMTLAEWAQYYEAGEKERLLNVVSLSLAGTPLEVCHQLRPPTKGHQLYVLLSKAQRDCSWRSLLWWW